MNQEEREIEGAVALKMDKIKILKDIEDNLGKLSREELISVFEDIVDSYNKKIDERRSFYEVGIKCGIEFSGVIHVLAKDENEAKELVEKNRPNLFHINEFWEAYENEKFTKFEITGAVASKDQDGKSEINPNSYNEEYFTVSFTKCD